MKALTLLTWRQRQIHLTQMFVRYGWTGPDVGEDYRLMRERDG